MKIKMVVPIIILAFIVGCQPPNGGNGNRGEPTPEEKWNSWVNLQGTLDRKVLSVTESAKWIANHRSKISMPDRLSFRQEYSIKEEPYREKGSIITVDHNDKYRVAAKDFTQTPFEKWNAYLERLEKEGLKVLSVTESEQWMEDNRSKIPKIWLEMLEDMYRRLHIEGPYIPIPQDLNIPGEIYDDVVLDHNGKWRRIILK